MNSDSILERISKTIHKNDPFAEAYLFGSRARGTSKPNSDWDILILIDGSKVTNEIEDKFRGDLYDIELASGQVISIFVYSKDFWKNNRDFSPLFRNVQKDGIRL